MSNGIPSSPYGRIPAYGPVQLAQQPARTRESQAPGQAEASSRAAASQPASRPAEGLNAAEQQMIDRYFPASPQLSMRLYGPGRTTEQVSPNALGSRLDLRG